MLTSLNRDDLKKKRPKRILSEIAEMTFRDLVIDGGN